MIPKILGPDLCPVFGTFEKFDVCKHEVSSCSIACFHCSQYNTPFRALVFIFHQHNISFSILHPL